MKISENGIRLIKQFEGLRLEAYLCSGNIWTIGWGTTLINGAKVKADDKINYKYAEQLLEYDLKKFESIVNLRITTEIMQNQFDALVSHTYNTGGSDTLFQLINQKENKEKIKEEVVVLEKEVNQHHIVLHNDEVNTFDFVINSLINVLICGSAFLAAFKNKSMAVGAEARVPWPSK